MSDEIESLRNVVQAQNEIISRLKHEIQSITIALDDPRINNTHTAADVAHEMRCEIDTLREDAQALRLAVKLKIDLKHYEDYVVGWFDGGYIGTGNIAYAGDPYAATRRAIVRAAAEMAARKPGEEE